jgi:hypothetical protein
MKGILAHDDPPGVAACSGGAGVIAEVTTRRLHAAICGDAIPARGIVPE